MLNPTPSNSCVQSEQVAEPVSEPPAVSLHALFEAEESALLRYAYALIGRRAVAEEIVQDVFLQLHAKWNEVTSPRAWLYRSVRNLALNHLRRSDREKLHSDVEQANLAINNDAQSPISILTLVEDMVRLRQMLEKLPEDDLRLIRLKYFEGCKYREISEQTGLSIGNVGYRLHHILQQLASQLRSLGVDETK